MIADTEMDQPASPASAYTTASIPAGHETYIRLLNEGFLPILRESEGFVGYYQLMVGDKHASVSLFETAAQAAASRETAKEFIAEHLAPLIPNPAANCRGHGRGEHTAHVYAS